MTLLKKKLVWWGVGGLVALSTILFLTRGCGGSKKTPHQGPTPTPTVQSTPAPSQPSKPLPAPTARTVQIRTPNGATQPVVVTVNFPQEITVKLAGERGTQATTQPRRRLSDEELEHRFKEKLLKEGQGP